MGVVVKVQSVLIPEERRYKNDSRRFQHVMEQAQLDAICKVFGWTTPPWQEPYPYEDRLDTSIGNGRYSVLLSLAWALKDLESYPQYDIRNLIEVVEQARRSPSEYQYEALRNNCKHFPHTLDRNIYRSWYLPVDFEYPLFIDAIPENYPDDKEEFSIASSIQAKTELEFLSQVTAQIVAINVPSYSNHTWGSVHDACMMIKRAAEESITYKLPFFIAW